MKQYLFLATAIATASLFTGCSNNEYVGDQPEALNGTDGAIAFSMKSSNTVRSTGQDAAGKLNNVFFVYGTKHISEEEEASAACDQVVFNNYKVEYKASTASTTNSNTHDWEYVGKKLTATEKQQIVPSVATDNEGQTIKYWDYGAKEGYTFYAFSAWPDDINNGKIKVEKIVPTDQQTASTVYDKGYTVTVQQDASIEHLYFSARKTMDKSLSGNSYGTVDLNFYNIGSKIRMGFYETIPGYDVNITSLTIACTNSTPKEDGTSKVTVKYDSDTEGNTLNQPQITTADFATTQTNLNLGNDATAATKIGKNSTNLTWTKSGGIYTPVWPQSELTSGICKVTVDYILTSTDGSGEEITVKGATAQIPVEYVKWKANTAYTYIFKISDNTNGTTGTGEDPKGLYPITFDAVVEDMAENTYLTTVSTLSVTASQGGANFVDTGAGFVFKLGKQITLKVMQDNTDVTGEATITGGYINGTYVYNKTPEQNLTDNSGNIGNSITFTNGKTLPEQPNAGYWVLKVVKDSATTYVIIRVGNAEDPANPSNP